MLDLTSLGLGAAALLAVVIAWLRDRKKQHDKGREDERLKGIKDAQERMERGRDAVARGRDGGTLADRLRRNDGQW
jgi:hypothetical protein